MQQVQKDTARYLDLIFFLPIPYLKMKKIAQLMRDDIKNNVTMTFHKRICDV